MDLKEKIAGLIDHTNLKPDCTQETLEQLCKEAIEYKFTSVCVLPHYVKAAAELMENTAVKTGTVIGFPLGATYGTVKAMEADIALLCGAKELDMVINIAALKNKDYHAVEHDIEAVVNLAHRNRAIVKVIIETCLLSEKEKIEACKIVSECDADYIKTSTGFSSAGATVEDVQLMRRHCPDNVKIKAAGGIKTLDFTMKLLEAGADRIGTSSGINIINEL